MNIYTKRGDTLVMEVFDGDGDITGTTITASVRLGAFHQYLTVTPVDLSKGEYLLSSETLGWPIGGLDCDIKYDFSGAITHSETFQIVTGIEVT